jgi:hypothetical protein
MSDVSSALYWSLPGPLGFKSRVTDAARSWRSLVLSFPQDMPVNPERAVQSALADANIAEPVVLSVTDGMNISAAVGIHFSVTNMPAETLAHHAYGAAHAVVLFAKGMRAQAQCEKYAKEFIKASSLENLGDVRLVVAIYSGDCQNDLQDADLRVIAFDGGLTVSEMQAYVSQRMVSYEGPGSTSLYRHLVNEFAAFDPGMAERLADLDSNQLMALPQSLTQLVDENLLRWARRDWVLGTMSTVSSEDHPLHECYLSRHAGPEMEANLKKARRRYWRACVKALTPWMEVRREFVLEALHEPLTQIAHSDGTIIKRVGSSDRSVSIDELEYNDIVYLSYQFSKQFENRVLTRRQADAVLVCRLAKKVRDAIAHLRPPLADEITNLIAAMDAFCKAS